MYLCITYQESSNSDDSEVDQSDEEGIVSVGDKFVYSDEEEGDSTLTVRRIVRGGIVYVEEDDETLCLSYVRKKVKQTFSKPSRGSRRSSRARTRLNYDES